MEPTLHLKQGLTLLEKVLKFFPLVKEGTAAEVSLTQQDWLVLLDFVHNPASAAITPERVENLSGSIDDRTISMEVDGCAITVVIGL